MHLNPNTTLILTGEVTLGKKSFQIKGKGGIAFGGGDVMMYELTLPTDFPYGIEPETIIDKSPTLEYFSKAIDIMASESQVLILIANFSYAPLTGEVIYSQIVNKLENDSYIVHPGLEDDYSRDYFRGIYYPQNEEAGKWVRSHQPQIKKNNASCGEQRKKYLIGNWLSSAGYEVPAVIFVTKDLEDPSNATFCQRAKAKLVIYHAPM